MVNSAEDRLKSFIYCEIDRLNPGLYEKDPFAYFRLCRDAYEMKKTGLMRHIEKVAPRIKSYTLNEYLQFQLEKIAKGYTTSDTMKKKEKDGKAFALLRKFCADLESAKPFYRIYKAARERV